MGESPRNTAVGISSGTTIYADVMNLGSAVPVRVVLSADYQMLDPPGYPARPTYTGSSVPQYPHTISSGTTLDVLQCEATSLVNAGAAVLA